MKPINSEYMQRLLRDYPDAQYLQEIHDKIMSRAPYPEAGERDYEFFLWAELHRHQRAVWADKRFQEFQAERAQNERLETIAAWLAIPVLSVLTILCFAL